MVAMAQRYPTRNRTKVLFCRKSVKCDSFASITVVGSGRLFVLLLLLLFLASLSGEALDCPSMSGSVLSLEGSFAGWDTSEASTSSG